MPNHVHILMTLSGLDAVGAPNAYQAHVKGAISSIVGAIKSQVTIRMRRRHDEPLLELWQESFEADGSSHAEDQM
jgi:REP element-mobilizing transposase RayT